MRTSLAFTLPLSALLLVACAAEQPAQRNASTNGAAEQPKTVAAPNDNDTICTREYPTGSNIPLTKCRTRAQIEAEKAAADETMRRVQSTGSPMKKGG